MAYNKEDIMAILQYAKQYGPVHAAKKFNVASSTILRWNHKYKVYTMQTMREFSEHDKTTILKYAQKHGLSAAMRKYNIDMSTMRKWNEALNIYQATGRRPKATFKKRMVRPPEEFKLEVLRFAKQYGVSAAIRKYNLPDSTIRSWNDKYKIYQTRKIRTFSQGQKNLIIKYALGHSFAMAAKKFDVTSEQVKIWAQKADAEKL